MALFLMGGASDMRVRRFVAVVFSMASMVPACGHTVDPFEPWVLDTDIGEHCNVFLYYYPRVDSDVFCN
ncbi:MAG: hypothetical protein H6Q90_802 [Deltaproteobacteria bacterium]|nr:hypothetical protein [Deltaproteobacteria bacterium]